MNKYLLIGVFLAACGNLFGQQSLFLGRAKFLFSATTDSTATGTISQFIDQTSTSSTLDSLKTGFKLVSSTGSIWNIDIIISKNRITANVIAKNLSDFNSAPVGNGNVAETNSCGQIPVAPLFGVSPIILAEVNRYNLEQEPCGGAEENVGNGYLHITSINLSDLLNADKQTIMNKLTIIRGGLEVSYPSRYTIENDSTIRFMLDPLDDELIKITKQ